MEIVKVAALAPRMKRPLRSHWYTGVGVPVAAAVKVTEAPGATDWDAGWVVMTGAVPLFELGSGGRKGSRPRAGCSKAACSESGAAGNGRLGKSGGGEPAKAARGRTRASADGLRRRIIFMGLLRESVSRGG